MKIRTAELVGGLSLATDMGAGLPLQSGIAATILATRMAARLGLSAQQQRDTFYATVLRFIGCSATASDVAQMGAGDDISMNYALGMCDMTDPKQVADALNRYWAKSADDSVRRAVIRAVTDDLSQMAGITTMHCSQGMVLSKRLSVGDNVPRLLNHTYDRWDGVASTQEGDAIPIAARLSNLAAGTAIVLRSLGKQMALEMILPRKGGQFCPGCIELLDKERDTLLAGLDAPSCWELFLDSEPGESESLDAAAFENGCTAYADYADQKSGYLLGHSRRVAKLSFFATEAVGLDLESRQRLRLSALLHDVGRAGVPSGLWDKPTALTIHERQIVQSHNAHTETVLKLATSMRDVCDRAVGVHERSNKTGYPRAASLDDVEISVLAAADVYEALTHDRPWRQAFAPDIAANMLLDEAKAGRLPRRAVSSVLDAAGHSTKVAADAYPAGLTQREVEVLALLTQGLSTKLISERLGMSPKTAENHVGHVYDKTGARGRAAAALYAVEHGLHETFSAPASGDA